MYKLEVIISDRDTVIYASPNLNGKVMIMDITWKLGNNGKWQIHANYRSFFQKKLPRFAAMRFAVSQCIPSQWHLNGWSRWFLVLRCQATLSWPLSSLIIENHAMRGQCIFHCHVWLPEGKSRCAVCPPGCHMTITTEGAEGAGTATDLLDVLRSAGQTNVENICIIGLV